MIILQKNLLMLIYKHIMFEKTNVSNEWLMNLDSICWWFSNKGCDLQENDRVNGD